MCKFLLTVAILAAAAAVVGAGETASGARKKIGLDTKWLCYYGDDRRVLDVPGCQLFILESEAIGELAPEDKQGKICVAYMSVGEVEKHRWYWPDIEDKSWVQEVNPNWPDSRLVDPRSDEWQDLLVNEVAAAILDLGYDGFFLDNVDTPEALMQADAELFADADDAMVALIRKLRAAYPDATIIANNGLSIVPKVADSIDAMMYEGTQSTWKADGKGGYAYGEISPKDKAWQRPRLNRVKAAGVAILALEYADLANQAEVDRIYAAARKAGTNPFVSRRALDWFPGMEKLPKPESEGEAAGEEGTGEENE